ncbi:hypothetical protein [Flavobacterium sp. S87F.05.LMB.W.Kidney.N]|uniref:hypothetical protein n=1 Tax=Flavobacterium sp. S87F.05.LMB.W.Kidney.N TaxID=1278758 RepID=UPI001064E9BA|nr:hypothetical protein [Flavobacterium sp. S87F.05.LMB.W.Kidney.N]TDX12406.1 hypothetical protein EDB96_1468 [Flavobacterium sp. S87F.05.LMB.W.Kidney.N]
MKALLKLKVIFYVVVIGLLFSCKKNDGYSDQIETSSVPLDTTNTEQVSDTATTSTNIVTTQTPTSANGNTDSLSTAGRGSGPGESAQDGSTYTPSKGVQKDSVKLQTESAKKRKNK